MASGVDRREDGGTLAAHLTLAARLGGCVTAMRQGRVAKVDLSWRLLTQHVVDYITWNYKTYVNNIKEEI